LQESSSKPCCGVLHDWRKCSLQTQAALKSQGCQYSNCYRWGGDPTPRSNRRSLLPPLLLLLLLPLLLLLLPLLLLLLKRGMCSPL
jgi:hypothetical protein